MNLILDWIFRPFRHYLYVPVFEIIHQYKLRHNPKPPPIVCQMCGQSGHRESYCPNAREAWYFE